MLELTLPVKMAVRSATREQVVLWVRVGDSTETLYVDPANIVNYRSFKERLRKQLFANEQSSGEGGSANEVSKDPIYSAMTDRQRLAFADDMATAVSYFEGLLGRSSIEAEADHVVATSRTGAEITVGMIQRFKELARLLRG